LGTLDFNLKIVINLACLLLPGYSADVMISELHRMLGDDMSLKLFLLTVKYLLYQIWDFLTFCEKHFVMLTLKAFLYQC
jgi:hypothetical protein